MKIEICCSNENNYGQNFEINTSKFDYHEQVIPEIYKFADKYNIKPLYIKLEVINENTGLIYKDNEYAEDVLSVWKLGYDAGRIGAIEDHTDWEESLFYIPENIPSYKSITNDVKKYGTKYGSLFLVGYFQSYYEKFIEEYEKSDD